MDPEKIVESVYDLKSELGIATNSISNLSVSLKELAAEVKDLREEMRKLDKYYGTVFVTEEGMNKMLSPIRKLYYGTSGAILIWIILGILKQVWPK
jgi:hypothetical protein